jgi:GT2 family glycosyltransferase
VNRPGVSVVMPFAGDGAQACAAVEALLALRTGPADELILADNSATAAAAAAEPAGGSSPGGSSPAIPGVTLVRATAERSPAHARNAGAACARNDWILFLDSDCLAPRDLLDAYFAGPIDADVGALAGEVMAAPGADTLAARYGAARGFLSQEAHLRHPYRPRAVAANLLVRRSAFEAVGGFYEGVRAAEDTDFSWRLQAAGWRLELRRDAAVEHRYRTTVRDLRRQWRGYAAGRAWLARRYDGFAPEPAVRRAGARVWRWARRRPPPRPAAAKRVDPGRLGRDESEWPDPSRLERSGYALLDALLSAEELAGLTLSNRPAATEPPSPAHVVLVADRFPARGDPLVEFAGTLDGARVEAAARPESLAAGPARSLAVAYREDDGVAARALALVAVALRHPARCALDRARRRRGEPTLAAIAPAVRRLAREADARVHPLGGDDTRATAGRIAQLAGCAFDELPRQGRRGGALSGAGRR